MTLPLGKAERLVAGRNGRPATEDDGVDDYVGGGVGDDELLTIGAFAARARLSAKALRLYDRLGLLAPAHVDEATGYRYYRAGQAERARLVALLRRLDMPLARIAEVVGADGDRAAGLLDVYWADVEARVAGQRTLVAYLRGRLSGRDSEMYGEFVVETVDVPEQVVISETRHTLANELPAWIGASLGRLEEAARGCGGVTAAPYVVYHSDVSMESDGPAESCVPVGDEAAARAWSEERRAGPADAGAGGARRAAGLHPDHQGPGGVPADHGRLRGGGGVDRRAGTDGGGAVSRGVLRRLGCRGPRGPGVRRGVPGELS